MDWRVLLIGGNSGSGKTFLAQELARKVSVSVVQVDDIRIGIQSVTNDESHPDLHSFVNPSLHPQSPDEYLESFIRVAEAIEPALQAIMSHHLVVESSAPIILEGDGILPRLGDHEYLSRFQEYSGLEMKGMIKSVFIIESEQASLRNSVIRRGRGIQDSSKASQDLHVIGSQKYGEYLTNSAIKHNVPWVTTRPLNTLIERVLSLIGD